MIKIEPGKLMIVADALLTKQNMRFITIKTFLITLDSQPEYYT